LWEEIEMSDEIVPDSLEQKILSLVEVVRKQVRSAVNQAMVMAYWQIGQFIVEDEQAGKVQAEYGKAVLEGLSERLTAELGKGFDIRNLRSMRQFYLLFPNRNAVRSDLNWTHYRLLIRVENEAARNWYMAETAAEGWSTRALERQINSFYYERLLSSQDRQPVRSEAIQQTAELSPSKILMFWSFWSWENGEVSRSRSWNRL
jgi:DUF1016 N-terminal domain